jgi:exodeoxyribonuclease III
MFMRSLGTDPIEARRGLPGADDDAQSRYLEAAVNGIIVACIYLPNGNPRRGPKFVDKLAWFERLHSQAAVLVGSGHPVALYGDVNVVPTDFDIYDTRSWKNAALLQPKSRAAFTKLLGQGRLRSAGVDWYVRDLPHSSDHAPVWIELSGNRSGGQSGSRPSARPGSNPKQKIAFPNPLLESQSPAGDEMTTSSQVEIRPPAGKDGSPSRGSWDNQGPKWPVKVNNIGDGKRP